MVSISAFTFLFNGIQGGYPFAENIRAVQPFVDEIVVVDASSTDGTRGVLDRMAARMSGKLRVLDAEWGDDAGRTLARLHAMNVECEGDIICHFEGDEYWDGLLLGEAVKLVKNGVVDVAVHRLQVSQNGQRCRWYPWPVHRIFPKGSVKKLGETTDRHTDAAVLGPEHGYLWDVTNWFRDNWRGRVQNQAALWHGVPSFKAAPVHFLGNPEVNDLDAFLAQEHWTWTRSPFDLPGPLARLVGKTLYEPGV